MILLFAFSNNNPALMNEIKKDEVLSTQKDADKAMAELEAEINKRKKK